MDNKRLIVHFTHHKCGTMWFCNIFREVSKKFNLKFQWCIQDELETDADMWLQDHSKVDFSRLPPYIGSHMIRDPRDMIISSYFYHIWCDEKWCKEPMAVLNNKSYQEILTELSKEKGILREINFHRWARDIDNTIKHIEEWDYNNLNIMEIRYEDFINDLERFRGLFKKYGFNNKEIEECMKIVKEFSFKNIAKRDLGEEDKKSHLRKGLPGDWKNHFTEKHKEEFKRLFGDILIKLGYEKDNN